jgi:small subunit ribosomal protein S3
VGQKVHPNAFRLGVYKTWQARWYGDKDYTDMLLEDMRMRRLILERLRNAGISKVETERSASQATVIIWTAKPGIVIGKGGASVDQLRDDLEKMTGKKVRVTIQEIKHPELDAMLVAQNVAAQLERRIAFRRAIKQSVLRTMRAGAKGVKIAVSGRLGGAEMSRREWDRDGRVPLHTLKANIDFGQTEARTTFGRIGVSVWVYLGDFDLTQQEESFDEIPARQLLDEPRPIQAAIATNGAVAEAPAPAAPPAEPAAAETTEAPATDVAPAEAAKPARTRAAAPRAKAAPKAASRTKATAPTAEPAADTIAEAPAENPAAKPARGRKAPAKASAEATTETADAPADAVAETPAKKPAARKKATTKPAAKSDPAPADEGKE